MSEGETCEDCRFYAAGNCRRHPPAVIVLPDEWTAGAHSQSAWPTVDREDWCGDWKPEEISEEDAILASR